MTYIPTSMMAQPSNVTPFSAGVPSIGISLLYARADHAHQAQAIPLPSSALPIVAGVAAAGTATDFSRSDHIHPAQAVPAASSTLPLIASVAAIGALTTYARGDHVHPAQLVPIGNPTTRTLSLATAYQASTPAKASIVTIMIDITASVGIGAPSTNTIELITGSTNAVASGTGTLADSYRNDLTVTLISLGLTGRTKLTAFLPPNWFFAARRTVGTGITISSAFDQTVG